MDVLVSIIIPTFNRADVIHETLESIALQKYTNFECIIVDDGSTDDTVNTVKKIISKDSRFSIHHRPANRKKGAGSCRNYGYELSKGAYINWIDSDDLMSPNKIQSQIQKLMKSESEVATCKWGRFKESNDLVVKEYGTYRDFNTGQELLAAYGTYGTFFPSHSFLISRSLVIKAGFWNEFLKINQDGEFFCRVLINAGKVAFADDTHVMYRLPKTGNTSHVQDSEKAAHLITSWIMIASYLKLIGTDVFDLYLGMGKQYCYQSLNQKYKNIVFENKWFLKNEIHKNSFIEKLKRKLF